MGARKSLLAFENREKAGNGDFGEDCYGIMTETGRLWRPML